MSILIRNVRVLNGKVPSEESRDVFIDKNIISAIGSFPKKEAEITIDGQGMYCAPGFIDVAAETDHHLDIFHHPSQEEFLLQGITTIACGQEGVSLAPLLYGSLESFEEWATREKTNVDWREMKELLARLDKHPLGVNFLTFTGHSTIRRALIGEQVRDLTKNELAVFEKILEKSMLQGSFGMSFDLQSIHSRETPYSELILLGKTIKRHGRILSGDLRHGTDLETAAEEFFRLAEDSGATTILNNFLPSIGQRPEYELILQKIEGLGRKLPLYFSVSPFEHKVMPLYRFLPDWAQKGGIPEMLSSISDEWLRKRIEKEMPQLDPEHLAIVKAKNNDALTGYTLRDFMDMHSIVQPQSAMLKLMQSTGLRALVAHRTVDEAAIRRALANPRSLIASKGVSIHPHARHTVFSPVGNASPFPTFLATVLKNKLLDMEQAVRKITSVPADIYGLRDRGTLEKGKVADVVVFSAGNATPEVRDVIVNGKIAVRDGKAQHTLSGRVFRPAKKT